eukprot:COSAG03_NODE_5994_length_1135_cov_2.324324_1_plen_97_part_00
MHGHDTPSASADGCAGAWVDVVAFIPMGGLYIVSQILLIHFASASYMFLATAFLLPLQNVVRIIVTPHSRYLFHTHLCILTSYRVFGMIRCSAGDL